MKIPSIKFHVYQSSLLIWKMCSVSSLIVGKSKIIAAGNVMLNSLASSLRRDTAARLSTPASMSAISPSRLPSSDTAFMAASKTLILTESRVGPFGTATAVTGFSDENRPGVPPACPAGAMAMPPCGIIPIICIIIIGSIPAANVAPMPRLLRTLRATAAPCWSLTSVRSSRPSCANLTASSLSFSSVLCLDTCAMSTFTCPCAALSLMSSK
mmetsp:Transcript_78791/g.137728  ORF Transcript_78791/g.137728 Transcript_78791/m.137728 type:complete len:212 (+) Transcript_78791:3-638(+)